MSITGPLAVATLLGVSKGTTGKEVSKTVTPDPRGLLALPGLWDGRTSCANVEGGCSTWGRPWSCDCLGIMSRPKLGRVW